MTVNEEPVYRGQSPGPFTGLDLGGNLYLGSVPDYNSIPQLSGFKEGFVGKSVTILYLYRNFIFFENIYVVNSHLWM